jgi:ABC-type transport system involved in multi-copper enzyme maturation permease subunit
LRSPEPACLPGLPRAPLWPLLAKELGEMTSGRALWTMLLLLCPLVGYSFFQAVSLYGEASAAALQSPVLASGLSPLDGVLVPTLGSFYVAVTLLFPFVAIRALGHEKETGALRLLVQLPYRPATLIMVKLVAVLGAWMCASLVALSALVIWAMMGGHLSAPETLNLLLGHLLYGLLVGAVALWATAISESAATAAIITLAFTIGSWVLDFTVAGQPGMLAWLSALSLTQTLHVFEQGLLSAGLLLGVAAAIAGFMALAAAPRRHPARQAGALGRMPGGDRPGARHRQPDRRRGGCQRGSAQLVSARRSAGACAPFGTIGHHGSSRGGGPPLRRRAAQRAGQARAHRPEPDPAARGRPAEFCEQRR